MRDRGDSNLDESVSVLISARRGDRLESELGGGATVTHTASPYASCASSTSAVRQTCSTTSHCLISTMGPDTAYISETQMLLFINTKAGTIKKRKKKSQWNLCSLDWF